MNRIDAMWLMSLGGSLILNGILEIDGFHTNLLTYIGFAFAMRGGIGILLLLNEKNIERRNK